MQQRDGFQSQDEASSRVMTELAAYISETPMWAALTREELLNDFGSWLQAGYPTEE